MHSHLSVLATRASLGVTGTQISNSGGKDPPWDPHFPDDNTDILLESIIQHEMSFNLPLNNISPTQQHFCVALDDVFEAEGELQTGVNSENIWAYHEDESVWGSILPSE